MIKILPKDIFLLLGACILLSACGTTGGTERGNASSLPPSLATLESTYNRNPKNLEAAINYARELRYAEYLNRAAIVLSPFARGEDPTGAAKVEFAAIQIALGNYTAAEDYAQKAIAQNNNNYEAYHYLGIALDSKNMYEQAEQAYREALEHWKGNPTVVMNDLALNLAAQDKVEESAELLEKAAALAPDDKEIERNLRIIHALLQTHTPLPPKPAEKPATP